MDVEAVSDLAEAEALTAQGDGLLAEAFEVGVPAGVGCHVVIVVRNANVRVENVVDSPVRANMGPFCPETSPPGAVRAPVKMTRARP